MWNIQVCGLSNKLILFVKFCNIIDWHGFVNMSMLKSPTIIVGQFLNWYFFKCSFQNRNQIRYLHFGWFVNCNYMHNVLCIFIKSCNNKLCTYICYWNCI